MFNFIILPKNARDIANRKFSLLTVLGPARNSNNKIMWLCSCECGNQILVKRSSLISGNTKSCGCLRKKPKTHGFSYHPLFKTFCNMIHRCHDKNYRDYSRWGGKGIKVCSSWRNNFSQFVEDVGAKPGKEFSLDRIDNTKGYEPGNVKWSTASEQAHNRCNNNFITFNGETKVVRDWGKQFGFKTGTLETRIALGWPIEKALTTNVRCKRKI